MALTTLDPKTALIIAYLLVRQGGSLGFGMLLIGLGSAWRFGGLNNGAGPDLA